MSGDDPLCNHKVAAKRLTVRKEGSNKGRLFWKCGYPEGLSCQTFIWDDELPGRSRPAPEASAQPPPSTPSSSQRTLGSQSQSQSQSQPMSQGSFTYEGPSTPARKRAVPHDDHDELESPFFRAGQGSSFSANKRVKIEGGHSFLGQGWAPPSPATPASQPSTSQRTVTPGAGDDDEQMDNMIEHLHKLSDYVKKLKRKKIAAEKSSEVKSRKIAELQREVDRLKAREIELEEALADQH